MEPNIYLPMCRFDLGPPVRAGLIGRDPERLQAWVDRVIYVGNHPGEFEDHRREPETRNLTPETRNPKSETHNPKPEPLNLTPETRNPKPGTRATGGK